MSCHFDKVGGGKPTVSAVMLVQCKKNKKWERGCNLAISASSIQGKGKTHLMLLPCGLYMLKMQFGCLDIIKKLITQNIRGGGKI